MAKFLLISLRGDGLGLALRLKQLGHTVAANIRGRVEKQNYDGLIEKIDKWEDYLSHDTIVVFDSSGGGRTADRLRSRGHSVFGASVFADSLETDRELAFELMQQVGVKVPPFKLFYSWEDGKKYVKSRNKKVVFKPSGEMSGDAGLGSYVSTDPDDMTTMLDYYQSIAKSSPEFILQDFVEGVAVSSEGWFNGQEWIEPFNHTIEHKQIMVDDLGPSAGCSCNIVWKVGQYSNVVEQGVKLLAPLLKEHEYIGPIDLNTMVNDEGVWALEFTPRFGYDAFPSFLELYDGDLGELIAKMARKEYPDEMIVKTGFASALRVSIPPHPSDGFVHSGGVPIQGLTRTDRPHLYFFEVKLDEEGRLVSSRGSGAIAAITNVGDSIHDSFEGPYELAKRLRIPDKQYRTDAEKVLSIDHARLERFVALGHNQLKEVGGNP